jgi:prephenate dehydrogenase
MDALAADIQAVGGHPMCGVAENGYANAFPTLYAGARFILCETARTADHSRHLCEQLLAAIGATPIWMDRDHHDYMAGAISHLPHLMSFALMRLAMHLNQNGSSIYELAAGGFDGATRLARTDEAMITGMFRTNAPILRELVGQLQQHLDDLTALLDDPERLRQELNMIVEERRNYTQEYGERLIT